MKIQQSNRHASNKNHSGIGPAVPGAVQKLPCIRQQIRRRTRPAYYHQRRASLDGIVRCPPVSKSALCEAKMKRA